MHIDESLEHTVDQSSQDQKKLCGVIPFIKLESRQHESKGKGGVRKDRG